jgi:hypothetical protein
MVNDSRWAEHHRLDRCQLIRKANPRGNRWQHVKAWDAMIEVHARARDSRGNRVSIG